MNKEKGVVNLIIAGVALPTILLLCSAALDYARIPLTKALLEKTLYDAVFSADSNWECNSITASGPPVSVDLSTLTTDSSGTESSGADAVTSCSDSFGIEPFLPAANNFCFLSGDSVIFNPLFGVANCPGIGGGSAFPKKRGVMSKEILIAYNMAVTTRILSALTGVAPSWPYLFKARDVLIETSLASILVAPNSLKIDCPIADPVRQGDLDNESALRIGDSSNPISVCHIISSQVRDSNVDLNWKTPKCGSSPSQLRACNDISLPSYWILAVGNIELKSFLGGLAWPGDAYGKSSYLVKTWIMVPTTNVAAIEPGI
mgnify:CR=1 FL=1